jgi:hypothetical protein
MLDAVGGCFRVVHLGASAIEADDVNPLPTTETEGTTSVGKDGAFITLTNVVKEKSEVIRIAEATVRAVAERADEEGPSVTNQAIRIEKTVANAVTSKSKVVSEHTNTEAGAVDVNKESEVPAKVKATRTRIEVGNVDTTEVSSKVKAMRAGIEEGNVDTTEATFTTSTSIVTGNVGGKSVALARGKAVASKPVTTSAAEQREEAAGLEAVAIFPGNVEEKPIEVNPEDIGHAANNIADRSLEVNSEDASEAATTLPSESGANEDASLEHPAEGPSEIADSKVLDTPVDSEGLMPEVDHKGVEPTTIAEADKGAAEPEPFVRYYFCVPLCAA